MLFLLIPDQVQPRVFNGSFANQLKANATVVVASGYNVFFNLLRFKPTNNVVMVAPRYAHVSWDQIPMTKRLYRMIGSSVRSLFEKGKGFPCFVSVEQDGTENALRLALALSKGIGATKAGAIASSAREETIMDLLAGTVDDCYNKDAPHILIKSRLSGPTSSCFSGQSAKVVMRLG